MEKKDLPKESQEEIGTKKKNVGFALSDKSDGSELSLNEE